MNELDKQVPLGRRPGVHFPLASRSLLCSRSGGSLPDLPLWFMRLVGLNPFVIQLRPPSPLFSAEVFRYLPKSAFDGFYQCCYPIFSKQGQKRWIGR